ncbi:MAG: flippase-like domain-containing protein [Dehalococcoidia bacterium]|nr:flippase-like domain-containing protein [Dehalococcoidia bacterium]
MLKRLRASCSHHSGPPSLRRLVSIPTVVSLSIAIGLLALLLTRFNIDLGATWDVIGSANLSLFLLAMVVHYAGLVVRGARWHMMAWNAQIGREAGGSLLGRAETTTLLLAGWFLNSVGWLRMGDAYRAYAYGRRAGVPFSLSLGVVAAERVVDVIATVPLVLLAVAGTAASDEGSGSVAYLVISLTLAGLAVAFLLGMLVLGERLARRLPKPVQESYRRFRKGILGSFRRLPLVGSVSIAVWVLEALRLHLVVQALDVPVGVPLVLLVALVNAVLTTIPLTPGGVGFVETGMVGVLTIALPRDTALAVALTDRAISYGSILISGGAALAFYELVWMRRTGIRQPVVSPASAQGAAGDERPRNDGEGG